MTLAWYLSRMALARIAVALAGLVALALAITLLEAAPDLLREGGAGRVARFAALRAALLADELAAVAILSGAALTFATLAARSEMVALRAAGMSAARLMLRLAPLALALAGAGYALSECAAPAAEAALARDFPGVAARAPEQGPVWAALGRETARFTVADASGAALAQVTIFSMDPGGAILSRTDAAAARWTGNGWRLEAALLADAQGVRPAPPGLWRPPLDPASALSLTRRPERVSSGEARAALAGARPLARGSAYLRTRLADVWAATLTPAMLLCFAALAGFGPPRGAGGGMLALGLTLGLLYIALDGAFGGLGGAGALSPVTAAFAPKAVGALAALWAILMAEG